MISGSQADAYHELDRMMDVDRFAVGVKVSAVAVLNRRLYFGGEQGLFLAPDIREFRNGRQPVHLSEEFNVGAFGRDPWGSLYFVCNTNKAFYGLKGEQAIEITPRNVFLGSVFCFCLDERKNIIFADMEAKEITLYRGDGHCQVLSRTESSSFVLLEDGGLVSTSLTRNEVVTIYHGLEKTACSAIKGEPLRHPHSLVKYKNVILGV